MLTADDTVHVAVESDLTVISLVFGRHRGHYRKFANISSGLYKILPTPRPPCGLYAVAGNLKLFLHRQKLHPR